MKEHQHAKVECKNCGYTNIINCFPDFDFERKFYLEFKPDCPGCKQRDWEIFELVEVVKPLSDEEREIFSMGGKQ
ncbi:hypothetical protein ACNF40_08725 [Cuniculiplasma sp. SKW4]|uniref:hypothetical protein n=1 Tax=Cuniculiplasma sp. SKW4 TaxID=3400171 RepID=UPI003FD0FD22